MIAGFIFLHTLNAANLDYFTEWKYDANTDKMLNDLENEKSNAFDSSNKLKLGINWLFEPTINFYRETKNLDWLDSVTRDGIAAKYDYYYILHDDSISMENRTILKDYPISNSLLVK